MSPFPRRFMKILEVKPKRQRKSSLPKPRFFSDVLGLDNIMIENKSIHPVAEFVRQKIYARFLHGGPLGLSFDDALLVVSQELNNEFESWPNELIMQVASRLTYTTKSEIDELGVFGWLKKGLRKEVKLEEGKELVDIVFDATVDRIRGRPNGYHPAILKIVDNLPETNFQQARTAIDRSTPCQENSRSSILSKSVTGRSADTCNGTKSTPSPHS